MLHYQATNIDIKHHNVLDNLEKQDFSSPLFVLFAENPDQSMWEKIPFGKLLFKRWQKQQETNKLTTNQKEDVEELSSFTSQLPNEQGTKVSIINLSKFTSTFKQLEILRKNIVNIAEHKPHNINLIIFGNISEQTVNNFITCVGCYYSNLPKISQKDYIEPNLNLEINIYNCQHNYEHARAIAEIHGNGLTRYLCNLPVNHLYPETYSNYIKELAKELGWSYEFIDQEQLKNKQAGAFLAVAQGSTKKDAGIVHVTYKPKHSFNKKIALVGKGMCFDTGGHNLKTPLGSMYGMKHDMTGSAVALGTMLALTKLQVPFQIDAWLALAENDISPTAYKPGDVVFASNGMSIEVVNTDAEGRMVLSDTLYFASQDKPNLVIDYATLTGSCVRALDELYSGVVTNQYEWNSKLMNIGQECGERVWPFPYTDDYDKVLESDIADIKQCHEGSADQIRAARFLGNFIQNNIPWIHMDLSSHENKGGLGHIASNTTGFGVRYTLALLLDNGLV